MTHIDEELDVDQPRSALDAVMWVAVVVIVLSAITWWLGGFTGLTILFWIVLLVGYVALIFKDRDLVLALIRLLATLVLVILGLIMYFTALPLLFAEFFSPIGQWLQDDVGKGGLLFTLLAVVVGGVSGFLAVRFYLSRSIPRILLSILLGIPPVFLLMGMIMQENL